MVIVRCQCIYAVSVDAWNPNLMISSKVQYEKPVLSNIGSVFTGRYILEEEERKEIFDTSIVLLSLKKRTWDNIAPDHNITSVRVFTNIPKIHSIFIINCEW